jgi:SulP family sulfate permease
MTVASATAPPKIPGRLAGELWGGFAAMLVALPAAMAYGIAVYGVLGPGYVSAGVRAGIVGAAILGVLAPLLGGAPRLISAPCAPAAAVLAALAAELLGAPSTGAAAPEPARIVVLLVLVAAVAGALQLAYGTLRVGRLIKYIPYPVVSGYLSGVAVLIFSSQVPKFLGLPAEWATWTGVVSPGRWQAAALVVGCGAIAGMVAAPLVTKAVPAVIVGLAGGLAAYAACGWFDPALRQLEGNPLVIGAIDDGGGGLGSAVWAQWSGLLSVGWADLKLVWVPALTLSVLLSVDTLKTCVVLDALTLGRHNSNRELIGQGAGNLASALLGGMPGAGTMGATLVNRESGGTTRWSGVVEGALVVAVFLVLGRWIAWVPVPALAGLLMVVAFRMFDWRNFALLRQRSTVLDFAVIAAVVGVAVKLNLIAAAGVGLGLAMLLFIREQIRGSVIRRKVSGSKFPSKQHRLPAEQAVLERRGEQTTICELQGSLFFGTTDQVLTELDEDLKRCRYLVLDWRRVRSVDFTAAHLLERFEAMLKERNGYLLFSRLPKALSKGQDLRRYFEQVGVMKEQVRLFETLDDAVQWVEDRLLAEELPGDREAEAPLGLGEFEVTRPLADGGGRAVLEAWVEARSLAAGEVVFRAGARADELYLIRRGIVRIVLPLADDSHHNLASFGRGNFFGELAFLDGGVRSADALATTATDLFVLSRARFDRMAQANPEVGMRVFAELARAIALRLRRSDAEIRALYDA